MSVEATTQPESTEEFKMRTGSDTLIRVLKYSVAKLAMQLVTVVIGIFLTIMIANMGGYVDQIMRGQIREGIVLRMQTDPVFQQLTSTEKNELIAIEIEAEELRLGLDQPFALRSIKFLKDAMTLDLGRAQMMTSDTGSKEVKNIILDRLPPSLLLFGVANLLLFFGAVIFSLALSRRYGSFWDKFVIALSPTSSAPPWFYGIFLIMLFAAVWGILPFGGMVDPTPPERGSWAYVLNVLKHIILPVMAILVSSIFVSIYNYRTFFLIYSSEDYVEMAKAKGLSDREIERRYILRPTLPTIITNFSLMLIAMWQGSILTETIFMWPGLGRTFYQAIGLYDTSVIVGLTILYAYLLVITVFLLEFIYALVDPRVKIGSGS